MSTTSTIPTCENDQETQPMTTKSRTRPDLADALTDGLRGAFISPNVADSNMEPANSVDALDALGRRIQTASSRLADALDNLAEAIREGHLHA